MIPLSHVEGVAVCEKLDPRVGDIERRRVSKELDLAFSFEAAEGRWAAKAQTNAKLLKSPSKTISNRKITWFAGMGSKGHRGHCGIVTKRICIPSPSELIRLTITVSTPDT